MGSVRMVVTEAMEVFMLLKKGKFDLSIQSYNCLIDSLCKTGRLEIACKLFHRLPQEGLLPDIIYNIIINGLCKEGQLEEANELLWNMNKKGCTPTVITYNNTLMHGFMQNNETIKMMELFNGRCFNGFYCYRLACK
ncbi:hypothetical protein ACOSP7_022056 [Xanthoceras sorbifolium]